MEWICRASCLTAVFSLIGLRSVVTSVSNKYFAETCSGSISTQEMDALYALYESTDGTNWLSQQRQVLTQHWYFPAPLDAPCGESWYGLTCSKLADAGNCSIAAISLGTNNLMGGIPSQIGCLVHLSSLVMANNYLTGSITSAIDLLTALTALDLSANFLDGSFVAVDNITSLTTLELYQNYLDCEIPTAIGRLTMLDYVDIHGNFFSGSLASEIGGLLQLTYLSIYTNILSNSVPSEIRQLSGLSEFYFYDNQFSALPLSINGMTVLEYMYGYDNEIRQLPSDIFTLSNLVELDFHSNLLTGPLADNIMNFSILYLNLYDNSMTGPLPDSMQSAFEVLFGNNYFTGTLPPTLFAAYIDLNAFSASYNSLTGSLISLSSAGSYFECFVDDNMLSGSFPVAKGFYVVNMEDNYLSGSLPNDFLTDIFNLLIGSNLLTGLIPQGNEFASVTLYANGNLLSGTIPPSIAEGLNTLDLSDNLLIGQFPSIFCDTHFLETAVLANNFLTGPLIFPSGGCQLSTLDLTNNSMNGTIPRDMGALTTLLLPENQFSGVVDISCDGAAPAVLLSNLQLGSNLLSGKLHWLSCLMNLTTLGIENNSFTGEIDALANVTTIQEIIINNNQLSGTLPSFISTFSQLKAVIIAGNRFIGKPDAIFDPDIQTSLTAVDISDNSFTGDLPSIVFTLPALESFASIKTCFSGSIPSTICEATALKVLLMDGITSGTACHREFALDSLFRADAYISSRGPVTGGIPACIWTDLPQLISIHLSSNGLTGSLNIPSTGSIRNLSSIVLSYNQLSGTIPPALFSLRFETLELSNNRFKGAIDGNLQVDNATVFLANNRLSGFVPFSFSNSSASLNVLQGNLFDCSPDQPKPSRDQHASSTSCGSAALNNALIAYGCIASFLVIAGVVLVSWRLFAYGNHHPSPRFENGLKLVTSAVASCMSIVVAKSTTTLQLEQLYVAPAQRFKDILPVKLTAPGSALYDYFSVLLYLLSFQGIFVGLGSMLVCIPTYLALKFVANGKYSTHTYQYQWLISSAFLTGVWPALCLLTLWVSSMILFVAVVGKFDSARQAWQRTFVNQPISNDDNLEIIVLRWTKGINYTLVACFCFLLLNVLVLSSVNTGYLYILLSGNFSVEAVTAAQTCVSLFKVAWDVVGIPTGIQFLRKRFQDHEYDMARFIQLKFWCCALNSVVLPFMVSLFVNSLCFLDLFIPQSVINENFIYNLANRVKCVTVLIPANQTSGDDDLIPIPPPSASTCLSFGASQQYNTQFDPPFTYSFQCGSSIITSYVPVLIYSCAFRVIVSVAKLFHKSYFSEWTIPSCLRSSRAAEVSEVSSGASSALRDGSFLSHLLVECVVLLTFGASSPPLACFTWLSILVELTVHVHNVAEFVSTSSGMQKPSLPSDMDNSVAEVRALAGAGVWPCVHLASIYLAFQVLDMVGDTNVHHPARASWAPTLACTLPLLLRFLVKGWYVRRIVTDAKVAKIVSEQSVVTINAMQAPVETSKELRWINSDGDIALTDFAKAAGVDVSSVAAQQSNSIFSNCPTMPQVPSKV
jgi:hypothetical protein